MSKKRLEVNWDLKTSIDLSVNLKRYTRYLKIRASENLLSTHMWAMSADTSNLQIQTSHMVRWQ